MVRELWNFLIITTLVCVCSGEIENTGMRPENMTMPLESADLSDLLFKDVIPVLTSVLNDVAELQSENMIIREKNKFLSETVAQQQENINKLNDATDELKFQVEQSERKPQGNVNCLIKSQQTYGKDWDPVNRFKHSGYY